MSNTISRKLPDDSLFEILSRTETPADLVRVCATDAAFADFCTKNSERLNQAQLVRKYPRLMEHPFKVWNMAMWRWFDLSLLEKLGATEYAIAFMKNKPRNRSWTEVLVDIRILVFLFQADAYAIAKYAFSNIVGIDSASEGFLHLALLQNAGPSQVKLLIQMLQKTRAAAEGCVNRLIKHYKRLTMPAEVLEAVVKLDLEDNLLKEVMRMCFSEKVHEIGLLRKLMVTPPEEFAQHMSALVAASTADIQNEIDPCLKQYKAVAEAQKTAPVDTKMGEVTSLRMSTFCAKPKLAQPYAYHCMGSCVSHIVLGALSL
jgi:hypothetical protein